MSSSPHAERGSRPTRPALPAYGGNRRVKGLRRGDVALLAGISAEPGSPSRERLDLLASWTTTPQEARTD